MKLTDIYGSWDLQSFQIEKKDGTVKTWGKNTHGLLIYTAEKTVSVSINSEIQGEISVFSNVFNSILFYAGTYELKEDGTVIHYVTEASDHTRIGKQMVREASLNGSNLSIVGRGDFGTAKLVWRKR